MKSGSSGITTWPHCSQTNQLGRCNIGLKSSPSTQYGHRTVLSAILGFLPFRPRGSIWQFDPVGVLLIALVFLNENLFEPTRLLCRAPSIRKRQSVAYHELLAAGIAPQDPHLLKTFRLTLSRLAFLYCYCPHVLNFSEPADFIGALAAQSASETPLPSLRGVPEVYRSLATMMSKVQITPTRTHAVKPIRIHCSGVRCFQIISGLAPSQPHDAGPVYRCADVSAFRNRTEGERGP